MPSTSSANAPVDSGAQWDPERLEAAHRNVDFANRYRLEFIKHCMSLAAAVFIFTVTFIHQIVGSNPQVPELIAFGWGAMILSLVGGLGHMVGWDRYYANFVDQARARRRAERGNQPFDESVWETSRRRINRCRRCCMVIQLISFLLGLIAIAYFCYINFPGKATI